MKKLMAFADPTAGLKKKLSMAQLESGITSSNFLVNMGTFIFIAIAVVAAVIFIKFASFFKGHLQAWIKNKYEGIKKKFLFNGQIKAKTISYLKTTVSYSQGYGTIAAVGFGFGDLVPAAMVLAYPFIIWAALYTVQKNKTQNLKVTKDAIGSAYVQINTSRSPYNIYHYPVYLIRRLIFVHIVVIFGAKSFSVQALVTLNIVTCAYYWAFRPHIARSKQRIEMLNEVMIVLLSYFMFFFSDAIDQDHKVTQYKVGYYFVFGLSAILISNILFMVMNLIKRAQSAARKKVTQ